MRIGIDLGGTKIEGALLDREGQCLARQRIATPREDYDASLRAIADLVALLVDRAAGRPVSVGIGIPGAFSRATGLIKNANSTWLNGRPLDRDLGALIQRPLRIENDANCLVLSEALGGAGRGAHSVFGVIMGTGTGGGIVIDGQVQTGINAIGGEWGHNPLPWPSVEELPGPDCYCGRQGCIETYLSGPGLLADHRRASGGAGFASGHELQAARPPAMPTPAPPWPATRIAWRVPFPRWSTCSTPR